MNILELCLSPDLGGLELYVFRSATALSAGHRVIAVLNHHGRLTEHFRANSSITTAHLKYASGYLPLFNARRLAAIIDEHDIDVMHMHWGNDLALAALAKKLAARKPALVYTRQMKITRSKDDIYHNFLYREMDLMLTITRQLEAEARQCINRFAERITTLYYGVRQPEHKLSHDEARLVRESYGFRPTDFVVGLFGRLEPGKGQHLLIEAVARGRRQDTDISALIVGHEMNPGYRETLQRMASESNVQDSITFEDFTNTPQQLMQVCDCVLLASREETFGLVLAEAMRAGIAVIGSNRGGVPEIINDGETGLLFESGNPASLFNAIQRLYNNPELKHQLANSGKARADSLFDEAGHYAKLEQHLLDVAS